MLYTLNDIFFEKKKRGKIFVEKELCYIFATNYMKGM